MRQDIKVYVHSFNLLTQIVQENLLEFVEIEGSENP